MVSPRPSEFDKRFTGRTLSTGIGYIFYILNQRFLQKSDFFFDKNGSTVQVFFVILPLQNLTNRLVADSNPSISYNFFNFSPKLYQNTTFCKHQNQLRPMNTLRYKGLRRLRPFLTSTIFTVALTECFGS